MHKIGASGEVSHLLTVDCSLSGQLLKVWNVAGNRGGLGYVWRLQR